VVPPVTREHAVELVRYAAGEIHNIAAIMGGIGSQEAVKVRLGTLGRVSQGSRFFSQIFQKTLKSRLFQLSVFFLTA
jgi:hypothetical protein